jgi:UDP-GlcNAc:undecaprenyl-phosphate GlcNAc-1-phosphate transferase
MSAPIITSAPNADGLVQRAMETELGVIQGYLGVFVVSFLVTVLATPLVRRLAVANGIVDRPDEARKVHKMPIAYLGGVAVYLGIMAGLLFSYIADQVPGLIDFHEIGEENLSEGLFIPIVPPWIALGMTAIVVVGLIDDVTGIAPRVKLGGQLIAAAALAIGDIGVKVAAGVLTPTLGKLLNNPDLVYQIPLPFDVPGFGTDVTFDLIYWSGTVVIAIFVLGATNASNLIDGLDGLLTGVTSIAMIGLLVIAAGMALADDGSFDAPRMIIGLAILGACLGFLPHNFNPAVIFLGDTGSLLLGYCSALMILSLGDTGDTALVFAGLIIYAIPIIDTILAIVRRKLAGKKMSDPDADHLHHMLKRALGVKGAVFTLYGIGIVFCVLGIMLSELRARFIYALVLLLASYIGVYAIKIARRSQIEAQMHAKENGRNAPATPTTHAAPGADGSGGTPHPDPEPTATSTR